MQSSVTTEVLAIAGLSVGILWGLIVSSRLKTNPIGAIVGIITGTIVLAVVRIGTDVAWPLYALIGSVSVFVSDLAIGKLVRKNDD